MKTSMGVLGLQWQCVCWIGAVFLLGLPSTANAQQLGNMPSVVSGLNVQPGAPFSPAAYSSIPQPPYGPQPTMKPGAYPSQPNWIQDSAAPPAGAAAAGGAADGGGDANLAGQIVDPTASVTQQIFQYDWDASFWDQDGSAESIVYRPVMPFKFFGQSQILRATIPYNIRGPQDEGLAPVQIFDLFVFDAPGGRWGIGPILNFNPNSGPNSDTFQIGPAIGIVKTKGKWTYGMFSQSLLSESVELTSFQPILAYTFNDKWSVSLGDIQLAYEWQQDQWVSLPASFQVNYIAKLCGENIRFFYNPQYNFRDTPGNFQWKHTFGLSLIVR